MRCQACHGCGAGGDVSERGQYYALDTRTRTLYGGKPGHAWAQGRRTPGGRGAGGADTVRASRGVTRESGTQPTGKHIWFELRAPSPNDGSGPGKFPT